MDMVTEVYAATRGFPKEEMFGLTSQLRRAAASVPANIAEGKGRLTQNDYRHFLGTARGSLLETRTHIRIAQNLKYLSSDLATGLLRSADEVGRLLNGLIDSIDPHGRKGFPNS